MFEPTGSVYLDAPRPTRTPAPETPARRARASVAGLLSIVGLLALTAAVLLGGVKFLVEDPSLFTSAVDASLTDPESRAEIETEIAAAIGTTLVSESVTETSALFGFDVESEASRLAPLVLADPAFQAELMSLTAAAHETVLIEHSTGPLDLGPITAAVVRVVETESPELARRLSTEVLLFAIDGNSLPDLTGPLSGVDRALRVALTIMVALPIAALAHPHRHRVVAWIGAWLLGLGMLIGVVAVALPLLAASMSEFSAAEIATRQVATRFLGPAALSGIIGAGMVSVAAVMRSRDRRRTSQEGAAAALGVHEPPLITVPASNQLDLSERGLVDVSHPLTNI